MLLGNFNVYNKNPGRAFGGPSDPTLWFKSSSTMHFYPQNVLENDFRKCSFPQGAIPPYAWILAPNGGGMASNATGIGTIAMDSNKYLAGAKLMTGLLLGEGLIVNPTLQLVVGMVGVLSGQGLLTGSLAGTADMIGALAGQGDLTGAIGAFAELIGHLLGEGSASASTMTARGFMEADIYVNTGTASTKELAAEVWNSVASSFDESGTMGNKVNSAGTAGDPWTADLDDYTAGTAGKKLKDTLEEDSFLALK
jgi:hypothetical protein